MFFSLIFTVRLTSENGEIGENFLLYGNWSIAKCIRHLQLAYDEHLYNGEHYNKSQISDN